MPYATVNGHRVHFLDAEAIGHKHEEANIPIVMIHGLGSSENFYGPILPELTGHRCIALTSYGAGLSKSQGEDITLVQLAEDVIGLMDHLNIPKAVVAGHSMGGPMVLTVAARHPDRVAGVVGIGPVNPAGGVNAEVFTARIQTVLKDGMEPLANSIPAAATNAKSTALQRAMLRELVLNQDPKGYASHCNAIVGMKDPGLADIKTPVLILAGDEDKSAPVEGCQYIHDHLGSEKKELKIMKGVGHWHCIEAPADTGKYIAAFASSL